MKPSLLGLVTAAALLGPLPALAADPAAGPVQASPAQAKPNILVIFGDDIGWMNVASYGSDSMGVATPNIDRIGREGLRLGAFYAQPSCTAGRAAFITGQLPVRTGLTRWAHPAPGRPQGRGHHARRNPQDQGLRYRPVRQEPPGRPRRAPALPARLRRVLGQPLPSQCQRGPGGPGSPTNPEFQKKFNPRGIVACTAGGPAKDEGQLTIERMKTFDDEVAAKSVDFLDRRAKDGQPFFLWHNATRQHVFIHLKPESQGLSRAGREDIYGQGSQGARRPRRSSAGQARPDGAGQEHHRHLHQRQRRLPIHVARGRHLALPRRQGHHLGGRGTGALPGALAWCAGRAGEWGDRGHD